MTNVLTNNDKPRLSAEESLPEPTSGSVRQQGWRLDQDRLAEDDMEGVEAFLEAFTSAAVEGQGQNATNAPQNGPSGSGRNPQPYRPPRPHRPEYKTARGSRGSRGSRGTARGPGRANIPPTQTTLSTPSSSCRPTGAGPNESGRRSATQGSGGGRRGPRSQAGDRPSQAAATPLQGRPRQQPDEPRPRDSLPDPKLSQQQKDWISKVRGLDDGDDAGWDDVLSELMRAAGDSTPTTAPSDDTLSAPSGANNRRPRPNRNNSDKLVRSENKPTQFMKRPLNLTLNLILRHILMHHPINLTLPLHPIPT